MKASGVRRGRLDLDLRFGEPQQGIFLKRLNRFLVKVELEGREVECFMANPARGEMLFRPGPPVVVQASGAPTPGRKTSYDLLLVKQAGTWVLVDTRTANRVVFHCLKERKIPELAGYDSVAREASWGKSRFDFYLSGGKGEAYLEVKSVSLVEGAIARFPDGVTERGRRHVDELSELARRGLGAFVLFLVGRDDASVVTPNFSVDSRFSGSLLKGIARGVGPLSCHLICRPEGVRLGGRVAILAGGCGSPPREGCYQLVIELRKAVRLGHPRFNEGCFPAGFFIYTGSARRNLLQRIARHLATKQKKRWHIDYLLASPHAKILDVIIFPGREQGECVANAEVGRMAGAVVVRNGFGSSDCRGSCGAHLYWFERLPRRFLKRLPGFSG